MTQSFFFFLFICIIPVYLTSILNLFIITTQYLHLGILTTKAAKAFFDITAKARVRIRSVCESNEDSETPSNIISGSQSPYREIGNKENAVNRNISAESFESHKDENSAILILDNGTHKTTFQNFGNI